MLKAPPGHTEELQAGCYFIAGISHLWETVKWFSVIIYHVGEHRILLGIYDWKHFSAVRNFRFCGHLSLSYLLLYS